MNFKWYLEEGFTTSKHRWHDYASSGNDSSSRDRMVASTKGTTPHIVQKLKKGGFKCDTQCPMYSSYKLCSHIVVAEQQKLLEELVGIFGKSKAEPNLTSLVMTGMPKSSGKKPGAKVPKEAFQINKATISYNS